jgi:salicylate hydroxylase
VVAYDENEPSLTLSNGEVHKADVIIAADGKLPSSGLSIARILIKWPGIKSLAREIVLGYEDKPKSSGYACFRAYFKGAYLKEDPLCREFVEKECVNIWIGNDVHLVQNTLRDGDEFNWILTHKDTGDIKESWFQPGDMNEVRKIIKDCDPRIAAAVAKTKECLDWKICYRDPIPSWVSRSHKIALLGDSCHPHLPTSAQGASQATESAAVLALCLKLAGKENVALAVRFTSPYP